MVKMNGDKDCEDEIENLQKKLTEPENRLNPSVMISTSEVV